MAKVNTENNLTITLTISKNRSIDQTSLPPQAGELESSLLMH